MDPIILVGRTHLAMFVSIKRDISTPSGHLTHQNISPQYGQYGVYNSRCFDVFFLIIGINNTIRYKTPIRFLVTLLATSQKKAAKID